MVFCTYCGQSFTRDEHLERHILTHTNVKPFKCFTCHMSFARRDLLQRHYTVHGRDQNNQEGLPVNHGMIPKSAGRTPIACSNCAKTKTKCDKKFPCSRCAARNLRCTLRPTRRVTKQAAARIEEVAAEQANAKAAAARSSASSNSEGSERSSPRVDKDGGQDDDNDHNDSPSSEDNTSEELKEDQTPDTENNGDLEGAGPSHYDNQSTPMNQAMPFTGMVSPLTTPPNFMTSSTMASFGSFMPGSNATDETVLDDSSSFLMDWTQLQMTEGFEGGMFVSSDVGLGLTGIGQVGGQECMLGLASDFPQHLPSLPTPLETPRLDGPFAEMGLSSSNGSATAVPSARQPSINDSGIADMEAVVAAQDGWNMFRCTPPIAPSMVPRTARLNLERLEASLKDRKAWADWTPCCDDASLGVGDNLNIVPLHEGTRDKLLAITQSFLHKALDVHRDGALSPSHINQLHRSNSTNFIILPPARVLEGFLRSYANSFERFFPLTPRGMLDANELLSYDNDRAGSLLVLMMISQGAVTVPSAEARWLTGGLTEACRISLFDTIETNVSMASDTVILQAALLFTIQAAWSGDKWQMDIAMGQRGMYSAMLRHSGMLEPRLVVTPPISQGGSDVGKWSRWLGDEGRSRLIYSWLMLDQELSFFHDMAPLFSVTEFGAPMPDAETLWQANSAAEWNDVLGQTRPCASPFPSNGPVVRPLSLRILFRHFLDDEISTQGIRVTPLQLRLLLHPLQALVVQYGQLLSCFSDATRTRNGARAITAASTRVRLEEVQTLLQRWYDLATTYLKSNATCPTMQANLIMYHLISLNAVTSFPEIERLARRENFDGTYQQLLWLHQRCITDVEEAVFHSGQVLHLVRSMPRSIRPTWWPGAVYRVALILWTDALRHNDSNGSPTMFQASHGRNRSVPGGSNVVVPIDSLPADHPLLLSYLGKREGVPVLTKRDGVHISLDNAFAVLSHCVDVIDEGSPTRLSDGIRGKLERLTRG